MRRPTRLLAMAFAATPASHALAQAPRAVDTGDGWIGVVIAIVLVIAVCVASFMSARRTHQD